MFKIENIKVNLKFKITMESQVSPPYSESVQSVNKIIFKKVKDVLFEIENNSINQIQERLIDKIMKGFNCYEIYEDFPEDYEYCLVKLSAKPTLFNSYALRSINEAVQPKKKDISKLRIPEYYSEIYEKVNEKIFKNLKSVLDRNQDIEDNGVTEDVVRYIRQIMKAFDKRYFHKSFVQDFEYVINKLTITLTQNNIYAIGHITDYLSSQ